MSTPTSKTRTGRFFLIFLIVALLIGGVVSFYASGSPDGLEYVAGSKGFLDTAKDSASAGSPLADYGVAGVGNARLSSGLAGVIGVLVTLLLAGGLFWLIRRRTGSDPEA
jgi:cobalt/nickel transport protein